MKLLKTHKETVNIKRGKKKMEQTQAEWQEVNPTVWKPQNVGDSVEGRLVGKKERCRQYCPPGLGLLSINIILFKYGAALLAAANPAGPAPIITSSAACIFSFSELLISSSQFGFAHSYLIEPAPSRRVDLLRR